MNKSMHLLRVAALVILLVGCHKKQKDHQPKVDIKEVETLQKEVDITINRYECDLFSDAMLESADKVAEEASQPGFAPQKGMSDNMKALSEAVEKLHDKYPEELIQEGVWNEPMMLLQLTNYLRDPVIKDIYQNTIKMYPTLADVEKELEQAYGYLLYYFPDEKMMSFYSVVPGIDLQMPSAYAIGDNLFIHLDMYLGENNKHYQAFGVPKFISQRCDKKYIAIDCFKKAIVYKHLPEKARETLLDHMIYEGKKLYFTELMFPERTEQDIIGYTQAKYDWAVTYQGNVWSYLIEKNLLFSKDNEPVLKMIEEAPFTKPFTNESPGRMGAFIGWKIIQHYMKNNPDITLQQLLDNTDSRAILNAAKYQPNK